MKNYVSYISIKIPVGLFESSRDGNCYFIKEEKLDYQLGNSFQLSYNYLRFKLKEVYESLNIK